MDINFKNKMKELSNKIEVQINDNQINKYFKYMNLLLEWNEKINLTAITNIDDIILKHFIDSMTIIKYIEKETRIVDVGTGAGFPGVPIAIMRPDVKVTLLDSLNKRILFLNDVIEKLDLKNVETIHSRAEDFGNNIQYREKYNIAVSRAVANLSTLSEYLLPTISVGGTCICMKGTEVDKEIDDAKFAIKELGGRIESVKNFCLPDTDMKRTVLIIKKIENTKKKYPRKAGMPSKQPLCINS